MIQLYSPAPYMPVVPGVGPSVLNLMLLQREPTEAAFGWGRNSPFEGGWTKNRCGRSAEMIEYLEPSSSVWQWLSAEVRR
jgi:hypothetical protein